MDARVCVKSQICTRGNGEAGWVVVVVVVVHEMHSMLARSGDLVKESDDVRGILRVDDVVASSPSSLVFHRKPRQRRATGWMDRRERTGRGGGGKEAAAAADGERKENEEDCEQEEEEEDDTCGAFPFLCV